MAAFDRLGLMPELCQATEDMGWILPTEVQDEAIPLILGGGDVMIAAETGSGKTGAFGLPLLQIVYETLNGKGQAVPDGKAAEVSVTDRFQLNRNDRDRIVAVGEDGLTCQARHDKAWGGIRANKAITSGRFYYELTVADDGLCRVGWATAAARYEIGTDRESFGFGGTGKKAFGRNFENYGQVFAKDDVVGCMLDRVANSMSFSKNGENLGEAFQLPDSMKGTGLFPAVVLKNCEVTFNFGETPFKHLPAGFTGVFQAQAGECVGFSGKSGGGAQSSGSDAVRKNPLALILEPTRELAQQVYDEITKFKAVLPGAPIKHQCFIGGGNFGAMMQSLKDGLQIVIGTPGRLQDLVKSGKMSLAECRYFVLDEADRLMDTGNDKDIRNIFDKLPKEKGVQVIICSATLHSPEITKLADQIAFHPTWVDLKGKDSVPDSVDHAIIEIDPRTDLAWESKDGPEVTTDGIHRQDRCGSKIDTPESRSEGLKKLKPLVLLRVLEAFKMDQCMIFCRTQVDCDNLEQFLIRAGGGQNGRQQRERSENLAGFKDGSVKFLICTDVAARGIDIQELPYVINMTLPHEAEEYIHRIGRVGRADAVGLAISLVSKQDKEKVWWHNCNRKDRGRSCTNTKLTDAGGCAIWFDERLVLSAIETRLGGVKISAMDPQNLTAGREEFVERAAAGALTKPDEASKESALHIDILRPAAQELSELEFNAQVSFHSTATTDRWASMLKQS